MACNDKLEIQQAYKFAIETMPVQNQITENETVEILHSVFSAERYRSIENKRGITIYTKRSLSFRGHDISIVLYLHVHRSAKH